MGTGAGTGRGCGAGREDTAQQLTHVPVMPCRLPRCRGLVQSACAALWPREGEMLRRVDWPRMLGLGEVSGEYRHEVR